MEQINPLLAELDCRLVELNSVLLKGVQKITLVLHKPSGLSLEDCVAAHRLLLPKLSLLSPSASVSLDILSPGVGRTLKSVEELTVFKGEAVRLLLSDREEWIEGMIGESTDEAVTLLQTDGTEKAHIPIHHIQKAKLV